jgi:hypothetical protein
MSTQRSLDLRGDGLANLWKRLPERCRREAIDVWARVIAAAAQLPSRKKKRGVPQ